MRRLNKKVMICLQDNSGETIAETLVSILISALALLLMATAIGSAVNVVTRSREYMGTYYQRETALNGGGGLPANASLSSSVPLELSGDSGVDIPITIYSDSDTQIVYYERAE